MIENIAHFKILDFKIPIGINEYYDLGYVNSIEEGYHKVSSQHNIRPSYSEEEGYITSGLCHTIGSNRSEKKKAYIYYLDPHITDITNNDKILSEYSTIITRSHEETHAAQYFGKIAYLSEALIEKQKIKINLENIEDEEIIARIGVIYALKKLQTEKHPYIDKYILENFTEDIIQIKSESNTLFNQALQIYTKSKIPKRKYFIF